MALFYLLGVASKKDSLQQAAVDQPRLITFAMRRNRKQKADSASNLALLADYGQTGAPNRARNEDANPAAYNNRLLTNNKSASLPVDQVLN